MITKEEFCKFINNYLEFSNSIEKIGEVITGKKYSLYEIDWIDAVGKMVDCFVDSHFTEQGGDWIFYWLWESVEDKKVIIDDKDMFGDKKKEYHLNSIDELWDFLLTDTKRFFKNV